MTYSYANYSSLGRAPILGHPLSWPVDWLGPALGGYRYPSRTAARTGLATLASCTNARTASVVKTIVCATRSHSQASVPVSPTRGRTGSCGHTSVKKVRSPMMWTTRPGSIELVKRAMARNVVLVRKKKTNLDHKGQPTGGCGPKEKRTERIKIATGGRNS